MGGKEDYFFVDTNIIVYCFDDAAPHKKVKAISIMDELWDSRKGVLSLQVLKEFFVTVTLKLQNKMDSADAVNVANDLLSWNIFLETKASFTKSIDIVKKHNFSIWDAGILASAIMSNYHVLYSEDLQNNQIVEGVRIINPFV